MYQIFHFVGHSFAILTFDSTSSIDQCLTKRDQIKKEHRLSVQRNLRNVSKNEKLKSFYITVHLEKFGLYFFLK
jgi:hypothetical protein